MPQGESLETRFQVVRRLGEGAFGVVEEAIDGERGLRVALKSLKRLSPEARERFKFEFRALADLRHPSLPLFYELFTVSDDWFFTMEVIDGAPLDAWVRGVDSFTDHLAPDTHSHTRSLLTDAPEAPDTGALSRPASSRAPRAPLTPDVEQRLRSALAQLQSVLSFLHARGYVHRDLKPSNIRVRGDGRVVLLDFGLAARVGEVEGRFIGTAAYAAPEQAQRAPVTAAADAYALGAIFYELIAGGPPFAGSGAQVMLDKQLREPSSLREICPSAPEDLTRLVDAWLERDPKLRAPITDTQEQGEAFIGRRQELTLLRDAFNAVTLGDTRVVVIEGESGIGKSTLVERALAEIRALCPHASVFVGRPSPKERVPFNAFDGVLARDELFVSHAHPLQRSKVHAAARAVLERHAQQAPVVIWIDDMQWADEDSTALLSALLRPPQLRPALFVLSRRPTHDTTRPFVFPCARQALSLAPLTADESVSLALQLGSSPERAASVARRSGGRPLFIHELSRRSDESIAELDDVLRARVSALPGLEQQLLRHLAVSEAPLDEARLAASVRAPRGDVASALEHLRHDQLVRLDPHRGVGYRSYHDRVRQVIVSTLSSDARRRAHEAILATLDPNPQSPDLPARLEHLLGAGRAEEAAALALHAAARAEEVGAYRQAASLIEEAIELRSYPLTDEERRSSAERGGGSARRTQASSRLASVEHTQADELTLRLRRAHLLERAHAAVEAADELLRVADLMGAGDAADVHRMRAARHYLASGDLIRGRAVLGALLRRTRLHLPEGEAELIAALFFTHLKLRRALRGGVAPSPRDASSYPLLRAVADGLGMTDHARGRLFQGRALLAALASPDRETRAEALMVEALFVGSGSAKGRAHAERHIAAAYALFPAQELPPRARAWERVARATFAKHERPSRAVVAALAEAEREVATLGGDAWWLGSIQLVRGHCLRTLGDLPELRRHAAELVEGAEVRGDFFVLTTSHLGSLIVWLADDAPLAARQLVSQVKWPEERATFLIQHWLGAEAEVEISLYEGRGATLLERLGKARSFLRTSLVKRLQSVRVCCHYTLARALVAAIAGGRATKADRLELRAVLWALRREGLGYATARAALLEAGLAITDRDPARALRTLDVAEQEGRSAELLLEPLVARCLRAALSPTEERLEDRARAVAELRALGVRVPGAFARVIAPGFADAVYEAISTAPAID
ncbi:MAG: protein kinase [Polyangiaceae bacterium]|nr:protein kinase [Polyangiaceae bacterium]